MNKQQLQQKVDKITWWHTIVLPCEDGEVITPGQTNHTDEEVATNRFGIPEDLTGKTVLDCGAWDGGLSFLAERRGAKVTAIDPCQGNTSAGFKLAKEVLGSKVEYDYEDIESYAWGRELWGGETLYPSNSSCYDIVFLFGTLYHVDEPITHLEALFKLTKEYALIETAISSAPEDRPIWEFIPGKDGDSTNKFYPNITGLTVALLHVGFKKVEVIYNDGSRATVKAYKQ